MSSQELLPKFLTVYIETWSTLSVSSVVVQGIHFVPLRSQSADACAFGHVGVLWGYLPPLSDSCSQWK